MRTAYAVAVMALLLSGPAFGGTITSLNPSSIRMSSGEYFLQINGSSLSGTVIFNDGTTQYEREVNATAPGSVIVWVPEDVVNDPGTYTVTVGRSNGATFTVIKPGRPLLKLHLPEHLLALAKSRYGTYIKYEVSVTGPDLASTKIECDPPSGSEFKFGQSRISCIAWDAAGNRDDGTIDVNVWDGTAPSLTIPESFELPSEDERGAWAKFEASAFDEIDGQLAVNCTPKSGSFLPNGRTIVNCETVDASLNPAHGSFEVFVRPLDIGKLALKVPDRVVEAAVDEYGAWVSFEVLAYGSADPDPVVQCDRESGGFFPMGETKVYCTATDDFDQHVEGGFIVEVVEKLGLTFPDVTAEATSPAGTPVAWETVAENWTTAITCSPVSGSLFALGTTSVDCESTDEKGRRAGGRFVVSVADTTAPHIAGIRPTPGAANGEMVPVQVAVEATDAVDAMPRCAVSALTAEGGGALDWHARGELEVEVRASANRGFRIQVSCVDASGNRATQSVPVFLPGTRRGAIAN